MLIKVCGITNKEDAMNAVSLGVNAIGFIFYPNSPRYVTPNVVEEIAMFLPPFVITVGVFVNQDKAEIANIVQQCKLNLVQLHGDESPRDCLESPVRVIKAFRVASPEDIDPISPYQGAVSGMLLDAKEDLLDGGTGKTFDWGLALKAKEYHIPLILSGGISLKNVQKAIKLVSPYGIDICSGLEKEPGLKDYNKMQEFMTIIRQL